MIKILERYSGRKLKDGMLEMIGDEFTELDETYLYNLQISANIIAMIYLNKEDYTIRLVRGRKETANRFQIVTSLSDTSVKHLDKQIDYMFEKDD